MTTWDDVKEDPHAKKCLDHGFIVLVDHMGDDSTIVQSARVSYGKGTKSVSDDRSLIRYLLRHKHTTPFEMVEFRFLVKLPIFVARQWVRHRTASINEYSGRYSEMSNEFYIPENNDLAPQSKDNKQGRNGELTKKECEGIKWLISANSEHSYETYNTLLGHYNDNQDAALYGVYDEDGWFNSSYPGLAKELSRTVLPLNNYTEWYWKCDLHNILHFLYLRSDSHAQKEIQIYARAMEELITEYVPLTMEAYRDYIKNAKNLSHMEISALSEALSELKHMFTDEFLSKHNLTKREIIEFRKKFNL